MQTLADALRASLWARGLTEPQLERVIAETVERSVQAGGYVACQGEPVEAWIGVVEAW